MRIGFTTTIGIKHPTVGKDRYSSDSYDYDVEPEPVPDLVALQPTSNTETNDQARSATTELFRLITQPGVDLPLTSIDRVTSVLGEFEVLGDVARWPHPMIPDGVHHLEATLRRVKG